MSGAQAKPEARPGPGAEAPDLAALERNVLGLGARNRDTFVASLFGGSLDEYRRVLYRLQAASSWSEASRIIAKDIFRQYQVNIYSEPAIAFTDAVEARFRDR